MTELRAALQRQFSAEVSRSEAQGGNGRIGAGLPGAEMARPLR
jgi:hypothetical protein